MGLKLQFMPEECIDAVCFVHAARSSALTKQLLHTPSVVRMQTHIFAPIAVQLLRASDAFWPINNRIRLLS